MFCISKCSLFTGGLTSTEIGTLTTTQVAAIEPASIAEIPAATFVVSHWFINSVVFGLFSKE